MFDETRGDWFFLKKNQPWFVLVVPNNFISQNHKKYQIYMKTLLIFIVNYDMHAINQIYHKLNAWTVKIVLF